MLRQALLYVASPQQVHFCKCALRTGVLVAESEAMDAQACILNARISKEEGTVSQALATLVHHPVC